MTFIISLVSFAGTGTDEAQDATERTLKQAQAGSTASGTPVATWQGYEADGVSIPHRAPVTYLTWHAKGDYFASVSPTGEQTMADLVKQHVCCTCVLQGLLLQILCPSGVQHSKCFPGYSSGSTWLPLPDVGIAELVAHYRAV